MAAKGRKIAGIYVPIALDTSAVERDLDSLRNELGRAGEEMMRSFGGSINSNKLVTGFINATRAVGKLRDAVKAFDNLKPMGGFQQSLQTIGPELRSLALTFGITRKAQEDMLQRMAQNQAITQQVDALRMLERTLGTTREETVKLAQSYGLAVSKMAQERYLGTGQKQANEVRKLVDEYKRLAQLSGQTRSREGFLQFFNNAKIKEAIDAFKRLNPNMELTRKHYQQIAQAAGVAASQVQAYIRAQERGRGILGVFTPSNMAAGIQSAMSAAGVVGGMYGVIELTKSMVQASLKMDNIKIGFESIYGSAEKAGQQMEFVKQISDRLGLSFVGTAEGAKKMFASFQGTVLEKDANKIFTAFSNMGSAMRLTGDEMNSVFLALSQMASKGKISAEELRQQLAERMPGAVTLFAKSIGVSVMELDKMLQDGAVGLEHLAKFSDAVQEKYRAGAEAASSGLQAELNRVSNAWFDLKRAFIDSDTLAGGVRAIGKAMRFVADNVDGISHAVGIFGKFAVMTGALWGLNKAIMALGTSIQIAGGRAAFASGLLSKFMGVLRGFANPVLLGAMAISAVAVAISEYEKELSPAEAAIKKFSAGFDEMASAADTAGKSIEELNEKQKKIEAERLQLAANQAAKDMADLFKTGSSFTVPDAAMGAEVAAMLEILNERAKTGVQILFDNLRLTMTGPELSKTVNAAQEVAEKLGNELQAGIIKGYSVDQIKKMWSDTETAFAEFRNTLQKQDATKSAITEFDKLKYTLEQAVTGFIKAKEESDKFGAAISKTADIVADAQTAFDNIAKLTKSSLFAQNKKINEEFNNISEGLIKISDSAEAAQIEMDNLGATVDHNSEQWKDLETRIDNFNVILPQVASHAIKNGKDFETMANSLWDAGVQAGYTYDQLMKLYSALQASFNVEVGKIVTAELQQLDLQIAQIGAKVKDTKALSIFSKVIKDADDQLKAFNALAKGDMAALNDVTAKWGMTAEQTEQIIQKSTLFGTKSEASKGGSRRRSGLARKAQDTKDQLSALGKEILSVEKKIGSLQAKIDDDPSKKYWADVNGELQKMNELINKANVGTDAERQKLIALRDQYAKLAAERAAQMREEERRQKTLEAAQKLGAGYGVLGDVNVNVPGRLQIEALKVQYQENLDDYKKLVDAKIITEQEFTDAVIAMNHELNVKVGMANNSMLANFVNALEKAQADVMNWQEQIADMLVNSIQSMSDAFADFVVTGMKNSEDLGKAFSGMVNGMIQDLARLFMRMMIMSAVNKLFGAFFGGAQNVATPAANTGSGGSDWSWISNRAAKGGVFTGGNISTYSGSVVNTPTIFSGDPIRAYATGGNVMGEKGPEVILPLERGPNGKMGVNAELGSPNVEMIQDIAINIHNNSDSTISATQSRDQSGNLDIQIMVEKVVGESMVRTGSAPFRALQSTWGGNPRLAQRG